MDGQWNQGNESVNVVQVVSYRFSRRSHMNDSTSDPLEALENSQDAASVPESKQETGIREAPTTVLGILRQLGPGLIVAGSIVGSGELIATTVTGAKAGFWLLWLIIIGCVIKVFVQVEMGRYSIVTGKTAMDGFDDVPGPRIKSRGNWLIWYWFVMFIASIGQLGGIVGGVGQALSISYPLTEYGKKFNAVAEFGTAVIVSKKNVDQRRSGESPSESSKEAIKAFSQVHFLNYLDALENLATFAAKTQEMEAALVAYNRSEVKDLLESQPEQGLELYQKLQLHQRENLHRARLNDPSFRGAERVELQRLASIDAAALAELEHLPEIAKLGLDHKDPIDDEIWAALVTLVTVVILIVGRFTLIQNFSTALVATFTLVTVINIILLQSNPSWGFSIADVRDGLSFRLPPGSQEGISIALMAFGIIGVGASELVMYPYWCQEKGYGRHVGPDDGTPEWTARANGWMRVMRWDAWCSMFIYTFATVAFYLLGASILWRSGLTPEGNDTIRTLSVMYEPVFGSIAQMVFLFGAIAVLYSTFFVSNAASARTFSDALRVMGFATKTAYPKLVVFFSGFFPTCCILIYILYPKPVQLVLVSGMMQALMLPMLAGAAIYYRYYRVAPKLQPGRVWDIFLWISGAGMLLTGCWLAWTKISSFLPG